MSDCSADSDSGRWGSSYQAEASSRDHQNWQKQDGECVSTEWYGFDSAERVSSNLPRWTKLLLVIVMISSSVGYTYWTVGNGMGYKNLSTSPLTSTAEIAGDVRDGSNTAEGSKKPNFVFMLIDDLPWNAMGYHNFDLDFVTPQMTSFARDGIIVSNYYAQEICSPSRASFLTGRYPSTVGMQFGEDQINMPMGLHLSEITFPELLKNHGGYLNYMVGKWNQGGPTAAYLPTSRGFDAFIGFLGATVYPWSKMSDLVSTEDETPSFVDMMYADSECYDKYSFDDRTTYATSLFTHKATTAIREHDFTVAPMFLYVAYQAVHAPFAEPSNMGSNRGQELTAAEIGEDRDRAIQRKVISAERQDLSRALALIDDSVAAIYQAMVDQKQEHNTYFIVASDNGGCSLQGGMNGPLRGNKGTLFEGGTKVDAFIFGDILPPSVRGSEYQGLMHVSDWFPTILSLAGIEYSPTSESHYLDGIDQSTAMLHSGDGDGAASDGVVSAGAVGVKGVEEVYPRRELLYNVYSHVELEEFEIKSGYAPAAIRDERYKLLYSFSRDNQWYNYQNESDASIGVCVPTNVKDGTDYQRYLFDLLQDPYEEHNIYGSSDPHLSAVQERLSQRLEYFASIAALQQHDDEDPAAKQFFIDHDSFVQPWLTPAATQVPIKGMSGFPKRCAKSTIFSPH